MLVASSAWSSPGTSIEDGSVTVNRETTDAVVNDRIFDRVVRVDEAVLRELRIEVKPHEAAFADHADARNLQHRRIQQHVVFDHANRAILLADEQAAIGCEPHKQSGKSFLFCTSMGKVGGRKNKITGVRSVIHGVASHRAQSCARSHRRRSCRENGVSDLIALRRHRFSSRDSVVNDRVARPLLTITTNVLNRLREALTARAARDMTALDARRRMLRGEHTIART